MQHKRAIELGVAALVALVPALILFWVFQGENIAEVIKESEGIKLGGPAALFVIVLLIGLRYLGRQVPVVDKLGKLKQALVGHWEVISRSADGHEAKSRCQIMLEEGELGLSGGQFLADGKALGSWDVDCLFLGKNKLVYLYQLQETGGQGDTWKGLWT